MDDVTFSNVSSTTFERILEHITGVLEGSHVGEGVMHCQGVTCRFRYDTAAKTLGVSVLSVPQVVTQGHVVGWLHDLLHKHAHKVPTALGAKGGA